MRPIHVILYTLLTIFVLILVSVLVLAFIIWSVSDTTPTVANNSTLVISLAGDIPEYQPPSDLPIPLKKTSALKNILDNIDKAKVDSRIKGILLRINVNFMGWAKIDELKQKLADFKQSGKYVIAYLGSVVSEKEYYLALAADSIFAVPGAFMEMNGLAIETVHLPGLFEKLGISIDYFAYGKYKSHSGETLGRKKHTAPVLEMLNSLVDWEYRHLVTAIAERRQRPEKEVMAIIDRSYMTAEKFAELGWIDGLRYEDQLFDQLKVMNGIGTKEKLNQISSAAYDAISLESLGLNKGKHRIALIYSQGVIQESSEGVNPLSFENVAEVQPMIQSIRRAAKSSLVKAIVFRVDSPGGSGLGCDLVWREILKAKEKKPVIVSMSDYAASGGYWVSMGATAIVAQPATLTGSIGIWSIFPNIAGLYDKLGLVEENVKRGQYADMLLAARPLSDYEKQLLSDRLYLTYKDFVSKAATARNMSYAALEPYAQGRSWMGEQAKAFGLVDELGGIEKAIAVAKEKAGLPATERVRVVVFSSEKSWIEKLLSTSVFSYLFKNVNTFNLQSLWQQMSEAKKGLAWPLLPYRIQIH
ncbi:MAG: signal peptide peptidase SppA [candidate division KSB1 bacterium]|nr:signal peptide peptidase SppA [candidate division KSB1 bacterium]